MPLHPPCVEDGQQGLIPATNSPDPTRGQLEVAIQTRGHCRGGQALEEAKDLGGQPSKGLLPQPWESPPGNAWSVKRGTWQPGAPGPTSLRPRQPRTLCLNSVRRPRSQSGSCTVRERRAGSEDNKQDTCVPRAGQVQGGRQEGCTRFGSFHVLRDPEAGRAAPAQSPCGPCARGT